MKFIDASTAPTFLLVCILAAFGAGCASSAPPPAPLPPPASSNRPPPPKGPTRTDFKTIAAKLVQQCVAGGWISRWRSTAKDVDAAKPRVHLRGFEDKTDQGLDPDYLNNELERRMRISGVFEMVTKDAEKDFIGQGKLLRLAERTPRGERISVYTATLDLIDPTSQNKAYGCEATVQGEM